MVFAHEERGETYSRDVDKPGETHVVFLVLGELTGAHQGLWRNSHVVHVQTVHLESCVVLSLADAVNSRDVDFVVVFLLVRLHVWGASGTVSPA
jgi:hypothetical protein